MKFSKIFAALVLTAIAAFLFHDTAAATDTAINVKHLTVPALAGMSTGKAKALTPEQYIAQERQMNPMKGNTNFAYAGGDVSDFIVTPKGNKPWSWTLKITNKTHTDQTVTLVPGYNPTSATGIIADGNFNSVGGGAMNGAGNPGTIAVFLLLIKEYKLHCAGVNMTYDNVGQKGKALIFKNKDLPFNGGAGAGQDQLDFSDYKDPRQYDDKQLIIAEPFDIVRDTEIQLTIAGAGTAEAVIESVVYLTFKFDFLMSGDECFRRYSSLVQRLKSQG